MARELNFKRIRGVGLRGGNQRRKSIRSESFMKVFRSQTRQAAVETDGLREGETFSTFAPV